MNRTTRWVLAIIGIFLAVISLFIIYISGKPVSAPSNIIACIGFGIGFLILMILLYCLSFKVGIIYTIILILLFISFLIDWNTLKNTISQQLQKIQTDVTAQQDNPQLDEDGNIVIEHAYDDFISLQWGTFNQVDMDLILVEQESNTTVDFHNPQYFINDQNSIWLDYDYQEQNNIAMKEVISILGMKDKKFSVVVLNYNGTPLKQDAIVVVTLANGKTETYILPAERFNDDTDGIHVCDILLKTNDIVKIMEDFNENDRNYR